MSIQHVGAVLHSMPELERLPAFVLVAIADGADRDSGWSFTTVDAMARAARSSRRAVFYALEELKAGGYIRIESKIGRAGRYRVLFDFHGERRPEAELYTRAPVARVSKDTRAPVARGGAPVARGGAQGARVLNNPNKDRARVSSPSPIRKSDQKIAPPRKKIPPPERPAVDVEAERARQLAELKRRAVA